MRIAAILLLYLTSFYQLQGQDTFQIRELPESEGDPLHELERLMTRFRPVPVEGLPVFPGGAVGFIGYDMVRFFEPTVPAPPDDGLGLPDMAFVITDTLVIFDHRFRKLQVVANLCLDDFPDTETAYAAARDATPPSDLIKASASFEHHRVKSKGNTQ